MGGHAPIVCWEFGDQLDYQGKVLSELEFGRKRVNGVALKTNEKNFAGKASTMMRFMGTASAQTFSPPFRGTYGTCRKS